MALSRARLPVRQTTPYRAEAEYGTYEFVGSDLWMLRQRRLDATTAFPCRRSRGSYGLNKWSTDNNEKKAGQKTQETSFGFC